MMETANGILARTLEDERAGDCEAALSSGVPDSVIGIGCARAGGEAYKSRIFARPAFQWLRSI